MTSKTMPRDRRADTIDRLRKGLPTSMLVDKEHVSQTRRTRIIAGQSYSPTIQTSFSGSTYYFAAAAMACHAAEGALGFVAPGKARNVGANIAGALWKAQLRARGKRVSGFKFSKLYLDMAWRRVMPSLQGVDVISNFQLVSPNFLKERASRDIGLNFFIDGTLSEYFETYGEFEAGNVDPSIVARALDIEGLGYRNAETVIAMSEGTADTLVKRYGVDPGRVSIVVPGANIFDADVPDAPFAADPDEFILCFVGIYPLRKGLERLLAAVSLLRAEGRRVRIRIIGDAPPHIRSADGVEFLGRINKSTDAARFVEATGTAHFGCLLSKAELTGIGLIESFRVGVPGLGTGVDGMKDVLDYFGGVTAPLSLDDAGLARLIAGYMDDKGRYQALRDHAITQRERASWTRVAHDVDAILSNA